jgi:methyl-accepting chemotaxis protein
MGVKKRKDNTQKAKKMEFQLNLNIKMQLLVGFLVPIFFVILVGVISSRQAEAGMISNFEESASSSIETQMQYLDFGMSMVSAEAMQMRLDTELQSLVNGLFKKDLSKASSIYRKNSSSIKVRQRSNELIHAIYIIPKSGSKVMSTLESSDQSTDGYYEDWSVTEEGQKVIFEKNVADWLGKTTSWIGQHPEMDKMTGYKPEDYAISYMSAFPNRAAVFVVDISKEAIRKSLSKVDTSDGSILGFITADGSELVIKDEEVTEEFVFFEQDFFQNCLASEELEGTEYVTYDGQEYFFTFAKSEKTGVVLGYLVPVRHVTKGAEAIKSITVVLVIIACIVAVAIGLFISLNISASMAGIIKRLKKAAEGDLTVHLKTKGKSEFSILSQYIMNVITNMKGLIQQVEGIAMLVKNAAGGVEEISARIEESSQGIEVTLAEIDKGVSLQASDAQDCLTQMDSLSRKIEEIGSSVDQAASGSEVTKEIVEKSIDTMEALSGKTKATIEITDRVKADIEELEKKSRVIGEFVNTINDIAEETNLLSLNASIEAARAGEAGRGFAVVAEAIRKLADGSSQAASEINKVVEEIVNQTKGTVSTAAEAGEIVGEQALLVSHTKEDFKKMAECTEQMLISVRKISEDVISIDAQRKDTLDAVSSISAVSEQTATASGEVYNISQKQMDVVEALKKASTELKEKMAELEEALDLFKTAEE